MLLWWLKIRRFIAAGSWLALVLLIPAITMGLNVLSRYGTTGIARRRGFIILEIYEPSLIDLTGYCTALAFIIGLIATFRRYRYLTYEPTWGLRYAELLKNMGPERRRAASTLKQLSDPAPQSENQQGKLAEIDAVLNAFDDIGLYVKGEQISPELAHHYFYRWLRGYCQAAGTYIEGRRANEPSRWSHLDFLIKVTSQVNSLRRKDALSAKELEAFLDEEMSAEDREHPATGNSAKSVESVNP